MCFEMLILFLLMDVFKMVRWFDKRYVNKRLKYFCLVVIVVLNLLLFLKLCARVDFKKNWYWKLFIKEIYKVLCKCLN